MVYVIGSGPAGVSCAAALLEQGIAVTMLDVGNELDPNTVRSLQELRSIDSIHWRGEQSKFLKANIAPSRKAVGRKYAYGSDFPYRGAELLGKLSYRGADCMPSLAKGGFSNVWGAAVLPYVASDIDRWPISIEELAPHYREVLASMDLSADKDNLSEIFPLYTERCQPLRRSRQAEAFLADLGESKSKLLESGISFGSSRLAVRAPPKQTVPGCVYCGLCMYGCPNELIYNSARSLLQLLENPRFQYIPGILVKRLTESFGEVRISGISTQTAAATEYHAERVYLACGTLASTQILLESLEAFDTRVPLLDSCYYLFPLLRWKSITRVVDEPLHTLAQVFMEIMDPAISQRRVHLQVYTYNDMLAAATRKSFGPLYPLIKFAMNNVLGRLLIVQGFLHSDLSPAMQITLKRSKGESKRELVIESEPKNGTASKTIQQVMQKLFRHRRELRAIPLRWLMHRPNPGAGFHSGGSFPMRREPGDFESDALGRPKGFRLVHVVDSTIFPSIPATTITLSVMANARRIASFHQSV